LVFRRVDVRGKHSTIRLSPQAVRDPTLCTRVVNKDGVGVSVIEHLLAALRICGVTNVMVEVNREEIPVLDGSALPFVDGIERVGLVPQLTKVPAIVIRKAINVQNDNGEMTILPGFSQEIAITLNYDRISRVIGSNNSHAFSLDDDLRDIAAARTFGWLEDQDKVQKMGLALGSSEDNTVAIMPDNGIHAKGGLRHPKELVMHKCLDLIGDISVIGHDIIGRIEGINPSHRLNNMAMIELMRTIKRQEIVTSEKAIENTGLAVNFA
jgi:UDP-3-O-[3-hydroxymyristoyl] N-acetylglucosamine deacetylase